MDQQPVEIRMLQNRVDELLERQRETNRLLFWLRSNMEHHFLWVKFWQGIAMAGLFVLYVCLLVLIFR